MQQAPETIGRYRVIRRLGLGGMAEVFLAERTGNGGFTKKLVIKRLLPHLAPDPRMVEQLEREARIGAALTHPNLVQTWDLDVDQRGTPFIVLEFVEGRTIKALAIDTWNRGLPLPIELSVGAIADAALGLHYLHEAREGDRHLDLVHRDISPDNLMIEDDGTVRVLDFGVARMGAATVALTEEGELKGKIPFMPPEQLKGEDVDRRCDIYALGVTLYWLLTGQRPFEDGSDIDGKPAVEMNPAVLIQRALADPVPAVTQLNSEVPSELEAIVMSMLAKEPEGRIATAAEVHDRLLNAVPIARSACEQFMREGLRPRPASAAAKRATTALAARMLTVPQRKAWSAADAPIRSTTAAMPAVQVPSETVGMMSAVEIADNRRRMGLSAAAGALFAVLVCGIVLVAVSGDDEDKAVTTAPPPIADNRDLDDSSDETGYDGDPAEPDGDEDELDEDDGRPVRVTRRGHRARRVRCLDTRPPARGRPDVGSADATSSKPSLTPTREVRLRGPASITWKQGGRKLASGNRTVALASDATSITAYDARLEGTTTVPIKDGVADVRRVRDGRLQLFANPAIQNIRVGTMVVKSSEVISLREGTYVVHYTLNRRPRELTVEVQADRSERVTLR